MSLQLQAAQVRVAVAANFRSAFEEIQPVFEASTGHTLLASFGSSGLLFAQIQQGAPFDLFLSADSERPLRLVAAGGSIDGKRITYARGRVALWTPGRRQPPSWATAHRFALPDPRLAPYGAAAKACLESLGLWPRVEPNAVFAVNVNQAFHFIATEAVAGGWVAFAQLTQFFDGAPEDYWLAPAECHPPIEQQAVLLSEEPAARAFLDYLLSDPVQTRIRNMGYQ